MPPSRRGKHLVLVSLRSIDCFFGGEDRITVFRWGAVRRRRGNRFLDLDQSTCSPNQAVTDAASH
jgi:hypothetical protein